MIANYKNYKNNIVKYGLQLTVKTDCETNILYRLREIVKQTIFNGYHIPNIISKSILKPDKLEVRVILRSLSCETYKFGDT